MICNSIRQGLPLQRMAVVLCRQATALIVCCLLFSNVFAGNAVEADEAPGVLTAPEMKWVFLPATSQDPCASQTDCASGLVCFGLEYTPALSGTLISYTTGFFLDCVGGSNPIIFNESCVMTDNSLETSDCAANDLVFFNSSGHTGTLQVTAFEPVILHQVCLQLGSGETTTITEDEISDLTTTISLIGGGTADEMPSFESYLVNPDSVCSQPPGNILGFVSSTAGEGIVSVNLRLFEDFDEDGVADNGTIIRNVFTNSTGFYSMASITPGSYVIVQTQPTGWYSVNDEDDSEDFDNVYNESPLDNLIPVTIAPSEIDSMNNFEESPLPGIVTGIVFDDFDQDLLPDPAEGLAGVMVSLFTDTDLNGQADNGTPIGSAVSNSTGFYAIPDVPIGHYVLVETTPAGYASIRDYDATNDGDAVANSNMNNDIIPVSIINGEQDEQNYFIDAAICGRVVTSLLDNGYGTLRYNLECAETGDTITFHPSLSGQTIDINSDILLIIRDVNIISELSPTVNIASSVNGVFFIPADTYLRLKNLKITGGLPIGNDGSAIDNTGTLYLDDVTLVRNAIMPPGSILLHNHPDGTTEVKGNCLIKENQ